MTITRQTAWKEVARLPLQFRTFHPQGLVKIGSDFYLSSVEVRKRPRSSPEPGDVGDGGGGAGVGHLFKFGADGALKVDLHLGEGAAYHPGGIDFDGHSIWAPVSEYRPDSHAVTYKVEPAGMKAAVAFRCADHIGAVAFDRSRHELRGFSWGSRRLYRWRVGAGHDRGADRMRLTAPPISSRFHYIDYQDCHYAGGGQMVCGGLAESSSNQAGERVQLGGLELIDLRDDRPTWQAPVPMRSPTGRLMTQNPVFIEATGTGLRAYFVPDDDVSVLYVYEVGPRAP